MAGEPATSTTAAPSPTPALAGAQVLVTRVIDGDTIEVDRALVGPAAFLYIGVDTPETVAPDLSHRRSKKAL